MNSTPAHFPPAAGFSHLPSMIRSELVARIAAQNPHLYAKDVEAVVAAILDRMTGALADGDRVELRDFGTFAIQDREARTSRNPRSGESVTVAAKRVIHFKPGKTLRAAEPQTGGPGARGSAADAGIMTTLRA